MHDSLKIVKCNADNKRDFSFAVNFSENGSEIVQVVNVVRDD